MQRIVERPRSTAGRRDVGDATASSQAFPPRVGGGAGAGAGAHADAGAGAGAGADIAGPGRARGFTLIELMVVVALIAIASAVVSLALRDPAATRLDHEGARLVALLESARTQARAAGLSARWEPNSGQEGVEGFRFIGLPPSADLPTAWLGAGVSAEVTGARAISLGPEPLIGAQRIVLHLDDQSLTLTTDGLGPFVVVETDTSVARPS